MTTASQRSLRTAGARALAATVVCALLASACANSGRQNGAAKEILAQNVAALERLRFGMSMGEAGGIMGRSPIRPPWAGEWKLGPQVLSNPFDTMEFESPSGETYVVQRYATRLDGESNCPFVRGEATLDPLVFLDGKLVGWHWSYLESALQRPLLDEEQNFRFGSFCGGANNESRE